jgi:hypothetical protein
MSFVDKIFIRNKVECPRCLGKGNVDEEDIRRLNKTLKWRPGGCAYCAGKGLVTKRVLDRVEVDNEYLTVDLPSSERKLLIEHDVNALKRAKRYMAETDRYIDGIKYLSTVGKLTPIEVANFYSIYVSEVDEKYKQELTEYIIKVVESNKA